MTGRPADNPFASRRIDALTYRLRDSGVGSIIERLRGTGGRGAIVGPHGSGKTTLLEDMAEELDGQPVWVRLNTETAHPFASAIATLPQGVTSDHTVFIDGAEQLGRWAWWRFYRRVSDAGVIVMTRHRPGRLPTIHECSTSPELLTELVGELAPKVAETTDLDEVFHRHNGNIRLCFRELYDVWAGRSGG